jgi:hypothetical protein
LQPPLGSIPNDEPDNIADRLNGQASSPPASPIYVEVQSDEVVEEEDYTINLLQPPLGSIPNDEPDNIVERLSGQASSPPASPILLSRSVSEASDSSRKRKADAALSSNPTKKARGAKKKGRGKKAAPQVELPAASVAESSPPAIESLQLSLNERVDAAKAALNPGSSDFVMIGRDGEYDVVTQHLNKAISEERGLGLYLCGMSGGGKTATVERVLHAMEKEGQTHKVVRVCGADLREPFARFAEKLNWRDNSPGWCEQVAEKVCMRHFVPSATGRASAKQLADPATFILFIDEIDKLPRASVKKLYEATKEPNSKLVVLGIANHVLFIDEMGLEEEHLPEMIVFPTLQRPILKAIILSRTHGLILEKAADMIAMKVMHRSCDVRLLLDLARGSIETSMRRAENVSRSSQVGDFAIVDYPDVAKHFQACGLGTLAVILPLGLAFDLIALGPNKMTNDVRDIPAPARHLLVAIVLDRLGKKDKGMKLPEMLQAVNTYMAELVWPSYSREEARKGLETLQTYSLVRGGPSQFTRRLDPDEVLLFMSGGLVVYFSFYHISISTRCCLRSMRYCVPKDWSLSIRLV